MRTANIIGTGFSPRGVALGSVAWNGGQAAHMKTASRAAVALLSRWKS